MNIYRHGDLLIKQISELPKNLKEIKTDILAEGEFTGHHHRLQVKEREELKVYTDSQGRKYFQIGDGGKITHEEHKAIEIEKGLYEVVIEREFNPFEGLINQVRD
jgi:hypothetical protein